MFTRDVQACSNAISKNEVQTIVLHTKVVLQWPILCKRKVCSQSYKFNDERPLWKAARMARISASSYLFSASLSSRDT